MILKVLKILKYSFFSIPFFFGLLCGILLADSIIFIMAFHKRDFLEKVISFILNIKINNIITIILAFVIITLIIVLINYSIKWLYKLFKDTKILVNEDDEQEIVNKLNISVQKALNTSISNIKN